MQQPTVCKTSKEKLRPTPSQERALDAVLRRCRVLYNAALQQGITAWRRYHISVTRFQQEAELKAIRAAFQEYAALHNHVLQDVLPCLDKAYQAFFRRVANGEQPGFPRFQGRARWHSCTYKQYGNGARVDNGYLVLAKIGRLAVRWSQPVEGTIKTVTVSREADGWDVCLSCAGVPSTPLPRTGNETGIAVGRRGFLSTADGQIVANPRHYREAERALQEAQPRVSRRKKGSNRRKKAALQCAKQHQHVRRERRDFHHKTALALLRQYDTVYREDVQVRNLARNHHLAKCISDAGWAAFRTVLTCKAAFAGKWVVAVPAQYISQECSGWGERVPKSLSVRTHVCPSCGLVMDRDDNAAKNILRAGQALRELAALAAGQNREAPSL
jgi:putative transposase